MQNHVHVQQAKHIEDGFASLYFVGNRLNFLFVLRESNDQIGGNITRMIDNSFHISRNVY